jgi:transcriptional regulator with XRE-family HTH domain
MTVISKKFADELSEKEMRDAYLEEQTRTKLAQQIRALRVQRDWSQSNLGRMLEKPQSNIARLEDREVARYTLSTLFELASAFDIGLVVEFVPYDDFLRRAHDLSPSHLQVQSFSRAALEPLCRDTPAINRVAFALARTEAIPISTQSAIIIGNAQPSIEYASRQGTVSLLGFGGVTAVSNKTIAPSDTSATLIENKVILHPQPSAALAYGFWR